MKSLILLLVILLSLALGSTGCTHKINTTKQLKAASVLSVIDGDTIRVSISGEEEKIRLIGIDTPESRYSKKALRDSKRTGNDLKVIYEMGKQATNYLKSIISKGDTVFLEFDVEKRERNGPRLLAYVYSSSGKMINEDLVKAGYALPYTFPPNVKYEKRFVEASKLARKNKAGLWNDS